MFNKKKYIFERRSLYKDGELTLDYLEIREKSDYGGSYHRMDVHMDNLKNFYKELGDYINKLNEKDTDTKEIKS